MKRLTAFAALLAFAIGTHGLTAQQQTHHVMSSDTAAERIPNLDRLKKEVKAYHDCTCKCGCLAHDIDTQANRAIAFLQKRAAHRKSNEKLALILDIDETTLSNYQEELGADFGYVPAVFNEWVEKAQAPAIPATFRLYREAERLGVSIFFITGRPESQRGATEQNLRAQGFGGWKLLVMRPDNHGSQTIGEFKAIVRGQIVTSGYTLVLNVGDQWSDLRGTPEAEYSVKYPDPFYFIP